MIREKNLLRDQRERMSWDIPLTIRRIKVSYLMDFELVDVEPPRPRDNGVVSVDGILLRGRELAAAAAEVGVLRKRKDLQRNVASFRMAEMSTGLG